MKRYSLHLLLFVNAILALVLLWMWLSPDGTLRNVRWQPPEPRKSDISGLLPVLPAVGTADTRAFIAMLERPLFSATRRPPPPPPPSASEPPQDNLSSARLSGVYSGGGEGGVIILVAGKQRRLRMNDNIDGWVLKSIQDRVVSFSRGGETRTLLLPRAAVTVYSGAPLPSPASNVGQPPATPPSAGAVSPPRRAVFGGMRTP
ncbi:hypothetical protein AVXHC19_41700 [Acidovorax sacchari]